jgi:protein arginine N-methyltransferase 1
MIGDEARMNAYIAALREAVTEDSVVLDLGSGTGIFSFLASKFGARKVYSVEPNALVHLSKEFAALNNCTDKIEFIEKLSSEIELEEKADVLICDLHGTLPLFETSIGSIIDARERLLKPGAILIPRRETVFFAVSECLEFYEKNIGRHLRELHGVTMSSAKHLLTNRQINAIGKEMNLLTAPQTFAVLDYATIEEKSFSAALKFEITQKGTAHGLRGWFECELGENITTTNSLENLETVYGAPFFPFDDAVEVEIGDRIEVDLSAIFEKNDYVWNWRTKIYSGTDELKAEFMQSTLRGMFIVPKLLLKQSEYFAATQNADAKIDAFILNQMDGEMLNGDIADELQTNFPENFKTFEDALERVSQLVLRYSV